MSFDIAVAIEPRDWDNPEVLREKNTDPATNSYKLSQLIKCWAKNYVLKQI